MVWVEKKIGDLGFFFFLLWTGGGGGGGGGVWLWLWLMVEVVVVVVGAVDFFWSEIYYFIVMVISFYCVKS